jgi:hypothetical protein
MTKTIILFIHFNLLEKCTSHLSLKTIDEITYKINIYYKCYEKKYIFIE